MVHQIGERTAPAELVSVEPMILHYSEPPLPNYLSILDARRSRVPGFDRYVAASYSVPQDAIEYEYRDAEYEYESRSAANQ